MTRKRSVVLSDAEIAERATLFQVLIPILDWYITHPDSWRQGYSPYDTIPHVLRSLIKHYAVEKTTHDADVEEELRDC